MQMVKRLNKDSRVHHLGQEVVVVPQQQELMLKASW
jgi:hypothetical protein